MDHININIQQYENIFKDLEYFFNNEFPNKKIDFNEHLTLDDFGVDAEDMYELILKLGNKFNVNLDDFNKKKFINNEPTLLTSIYSLFSINGNFSDYHVQPITIDMLIWSIYNKKWMY